MAENRTINQLEQGRAKFAYECARNAGSTNKDYRSYAKKFPMMIKSSGLGAALAFAFSKKKTGNAWDKIYNDIWIYLKQDNKKYLIGNDTQTELSDVVIKMDSQSYRLLTIEILAFLTWLRRFAEGLIESESEQND